MATAIPPSQPDPDQAPVDYSRRPPLCHPHCRWSVADAIRGYTREFLAGRDLPEDVLIRQFVAGLALELGTLQGIEPEARLEFVRRCQP